MYSVGTELVFIERCPLFGVSFKRGSTVYSKFTVSQYTMIQLILNREKPFEVFYSTTNCNVKRKFSYGHLFSIPNVEVSLTCFAIYGNVCHHII